MAKILTILYRKKNQAPTPDILSRSERQLKSLAARSEERGVRLMTENWFETLSTPSAVHQLFDRLDGQIGLCLDFGNWDGQSTKYADLQSIAQYAESCHTKAHFTEEGHLDRDDYRRCLDATRAANFDGPYTLISSGPSDDEWAGLAQEMDVVRSYL